MYILYYRYNYFMSFEEDFLVLSHKYGFLKVEFCGNSLI